MNKNYLFMKNHGTGIFIVNFVSGFIATFFFNHFHFNDSSVRDLLLVITLPTLIANVIYVLIVKSKQVQRKKELL